MKLPNSIKNALAMYYLNRHRQYNISHQLPYGNLLADIKITKGRTWDKDADLQVIFTACAKHKIACSASAGTFFFKFPNSKKTYITHESTFPELSNEI